MNSEISRRPIPDLKARTKTKVKRKRDEEDPEDNRGEGSPGEINNFQSPCVCLLPPLLALPVFVSEIYSMHAIVEQSVYVGEPCFDLQVTRRGVPDD